MAAAASPARDGAASTTMVESREAMLELQFPGHPAAGPVSTHRGGASLVMCVCVLLFGCVRPLLCGGV